MHEPIRARLEEYLGNPAAAGRLFQEHISECRDCEQELGRLQEQAALLRSLSVGELAPRPGFYARVMARIEAEPRPSVWSLMHDAAFGWRVALASAAMALVMAGYLASTDSSGMVAPDPAASQQSILAVDTGSPVEMDRARNSALATFASFPE